MQNRILVLFAHPIYEKSRIHSKLVSQIPGNVTFRDLYEIYPEFNIDVETEKQLLLDHDIIIWQHPIYWYSCPAILKQWIDLVLEAGWAYGPGGDALTGKAVFQVTSAGGPSAAYQHEGYNRYTIGEFLAPFDRTVELCKMVYLPPFVVHGTHRLAKEDVGALARDYGSLLDYMSNNKLDYEAIRQYKYLNDWVTEIINS